MESYYQRFFNKFAMNRGQQAVKKFINSRRWRGHPGTPPWWILDRLTPAEKEQAEEALLEIVSHADYRTIVGLCHLASKKAAPKLYALLPEATGELKADIATTLWEICEDEKMLDVVLDLSASASANILSPQSAAAMKALTGIAGTLNVLHLGNTTDMQFFSDPTTYCATEQVHYIYCLAKFPQPQARQRLEELANDKGVIVSHNAKWALEHN